MGAIPLQRDIDYPESDGQPMAETALHRREMVDLTAALDHWYLDAADVAVESNLFLYYVEGNPRAVVSPDVFVALGVPKRERRIYKLWEEGRAPSMVIEVTSLSTKDEDLYGKKSCYERLGVPEYFLHDPCGEYLSPPLLGYRLVRGQYRLMKPAADGSLISKVTGLTLQPEGQRLRLVDTATGKLLSWVAESQAAEDREEEAQRAWQEAEVRAAQAEARAAQEAQARRQAEEELARLRRELAKWDSAG
ncbi:MAG TPA: Uma2 family endonuclease [Thermoanaerobaculia bacterium]